jgi:hypothetical protein
MDAACEQQDHWHCFERDSLDPNAQLCLRVYFRPSIGHLQSTPRLETTNLTHGARSACAAAERCALHRWRVSDPLQLSSLIAAHASQAI